MNPADKMQVGTGCCPCGKSHCFMLGHYDKAVAKCGRVYWALQPKRNGPLALYPWPGPMLTAKEFAEKQRSEGQTENGDQHD